MKDNEPESTELEWVSMEGWTAERFNSRHGVGTVVRRASDPDIIRVTDTIALDKKTLDAWAVCVGVRGYTMGMFSLCNYEVQEPKESTTLATPVDNTDTFESVLQEKVKVTNAITEKKDEIKKSEEKPTLTDHILSVTSCFDCQKACMSKRIDYADMCDAHWQERGEFVPFPFAGGNPYYTPKGNFPDHYTPYAMRKVEEMKPKRVQGLGGRLTDVEYLLRPKIINDMSWLEWSELHDFIVRMGDFAVSHKHGPLVRQRNYTTQDTIYIGKASRFKTIGEAVENMQARKVVQALPKPKEGI